MLGVINSDVANLATTFDATERANTAFTAGSLSDEAVAAERRRRLLDYGPTPASSIPEIDANFLQPSSATGGVQP
jgi:hypothetical protein